MGAKQSAGSSMKQEVVHVNEARRGGHIMPQDRL